ncbi:MAG TPA: hypothetical protein VID47_13765, partial [Actinomycetota bacterium]
YMDAFARDGHIGMIYSNSGTNDGLDYIVEAKCNDCGTNIWTEDWRGDSDYRPVRRDGWTADCYPNCTVAHHDAKPVPVR